MPHISISYLTEHEPFCLLSPPCRWSPGSFTGSRLCSGGVKPLDVDASDSLSALSLLSSLFLVAVIFSTQ
jgi:hypothetical protein